MITAYRTKLFRSVLDCGCNLGLGEFDVLKPANGSDPTGRVRTTAD
jgi:hypothetical protein